MDDKTLMLADDVFDIVCYCQAALAQDSPNDPEYYINLILNRTFGYLSSDERKDIEEYLAEKKYLPPVDIQIAK